MYIPAPNNKNSGSTIYNYIDLGDGLFRSESVLYINVIQVTKSYRVSLVGNTLFGKKALY